MKLYLNTVSEMLWNSLNKIMEFNEFKVFRLVGGTSLSLQLGHRESFDIDLFTDADYGSVDFSKLEQILYDNFAYVETTGIGEVIDKLTDFENAESDFTPNCYKAKIWEIIKIDIEEMKEKIKPNT